MTVVKLQAAEIPHETAARLRNVTLLGSIEFAELWTSPNSRAVCWAVEHHGKIQAILAGMEFGQKWITRFQAMPDGLYSRAIILDRSIDIQEAAAALLEGIAGANYARAHVNDYFSLFQPTDAWEEVEGRTILVDISARDWRPPDKKLQSEIRKAEREGVKIQRFEALKHFDSFISLMKSTEQRHGRSPRYPERFFRALARLAEKDRRIRWVIVEHEGKAAASHIYFIDGGLLLNWQVYFDKEFSFLKPNQYITWTIATEASSNGVKYLNLGASPLEAENLVAYKKKWGGRDHTYQCLRKNSWLGRIF